MFRKPKRKATTRRRDGEEKDVGINDAQPHNGAVHDETISAVNLVEIPRDRSNPDDGCYDKDDTSVVHLLQSKKSKPNTLSQNSRITEAKYQKSMSSSSVVHSFATERSRVEGGFTSRLLDLATRASEHHSLDLTKVKNGKAERGEDGIFRDQTRNKFAAGPIRAQTNVRVTARFDYQPDICKDYKETGFCGFGDTCIYLHDRGDTLSGWQLDQQWELHQTTIKKKQEEAMQSFVLQYSAKKNDEESVESKNELISIDDLPFACYLCRKAFTDPIVTTCQHYFCQACILDHVRKRDPSCPICHMDTNSVFHQPVKLEAKKRRVTGSRNSTWQEYFDLYAT